MTSAASLAPAIASLLERGGIRTRITDIAACATGGNNRTYRVGTDTGLYAVKHYFRPDTSDRDRLASEYSFLVYASRVASRWVPRPYAADAAAGLALYEFVEGRRFQAGEVTAAHMDSAVSFFHALNSASARPLAHDLAAAAESCFSVAGHLELVGRRMSEVARRAEGGGESDAAAIIRRLAALWPNVEADTRRHARELGLDIEAPLPASQRCVSPSDFGFHNALLTPDGSVRFLDFEYAGWDDPAKMTGDFFSQVAVPVPAEVFDRFTTAALESLPGAGDLVQRSVLLRPVYRVKWCCIALNVFSPRHLARRRFADPALDPAAIRRAQLSKAALLLRAFETTS